MTKPKVFVVVPTTPEITGDNYQRLERAGVELIEGDLSWTEAKGTHESAILDIAQDCDALMARSNRNAPITKAIMQSSETLRIVAKYTIGVDDVEVDAATELGILVTHAPTEANWGGVAEGTITSMLTLLKKVRERDIHVKDGGWREEKLSGVYLGSRHEDDYPGITIGLLGLGRIGSRISDLLRPWGMRILACDPYVPDSKFTDHGVQAVDLQTLLLESDVLSLHVVLTKETWHIIGPEELGMMKPSAVLINTSRGPVVDEGALIKALQDGTIEGAVLDVFEEEPVPADNLLKELGDKVLLSPHMVSGNAGSGLAQGIDWATSSVLDALRGNVPEHIYNPEAIPAWRTRFENVTLIP